MERKKIIIVGISVMIILGLVVGANAFGKKSNLGKFGFHNGFVMKKQFSFQDFGLGENATKEEIMDEMWQKKLGDLGLTEESTIRELRAAIKAKDAQRKAEWFEKMGLDHDASYEEIVDAKKNHCKENPDDCLKKPKRGFNKLGKSKRGCFGK